MGFNEKILWIFFDGINGHRGGYKCEIFDKILYTISYFVSLHGKMHGRERKKAKKNSTHPILYGGQGCMRTSEVLGLNAGDVI